MKRLYTLLFVIIITVSISARALHKMSYKSVIYYDSNNPFSSYSVSSQISLMQWTLNGDSMNVKIQNPSGNSVSDNKAIIDLSTGPYFIKMQADANTVLLSLNHLTAESKVSPDTKTTNNIVKTADTPTDTYVDNINRLIYQKVDKLIDIDKNSYNTVQIGTQVWMAENLNTSRLNDGTAIPLVADNSIWSILVSPGYCYYNNNEATYKKTHGALYNLYAVNTGNLCPAGWHLPTDEEWTTLEKYLITNGYNFDGSTIGNKIGKTLTSTILWTSSIIAGAVGNIDYPDKRNITGFAAFPGGYRCYCGTFYGVGNYGYWWSATNSDASNAWFRYIGYGYSALLRDNSSKLQGGEKTAFSVRCVKDK